MDGTEPIDRAAPPSPESSGFERDVLPLAGDLERFAIRYTNNRVDAEDLVQETLLKAFKASHKLGDETYCKKWLLTIMRNTWIDKYRAESRRPAENLVADISDHHEGTAAHTFCEAPSAEQQALRHTFDADLGRVMHALPEQLRETAYFVAIEGMKAREVAELMDIPLATVASRMHRFRQHVRRSLATVAKQNGLLSRPPRQKGTSE